jgi:hypothetical protein
MHWLEIVVAVVVLFGLLFCLRHDCLKFFNSTDPDSKAKYLSNIIWDNLLLLFLLFCVLISLLVKSMKGN